MKIRIWEEHTGLFGTIHTYTDRSLELVPEAISEIEAVKGQKVIKLEILK